MSTVVPGRVSGDIAGGPGGAVGSDGRWVNEQDRKGAI